VSHWRPLPLVVVRCRPCHPATWHRGLCRCERNECRTANDPLRCQLSPASGPDVRMPRCPTPGSPVRTRARRGHGGVL